MSEFEDRLKKELEEYKNSCSADGVKRDLDWKGYQMYKPTYKRKAPCLGLPICLMVSEEKNEIRETTPEESMEYLDFRIQQKNL